MKLEKLIALIKKGDKTAPKQLYMETYKLLYVIAIRYVTYDDRAKDVLQNTYLKIFKFISGMQYTTEASAMAWMKKICVNESLKLINKNKIWKRNSTAENEYVVGNNHQLYKDEIFKTLLKLTEIQRIVFSLFVIEGYSHKEIAEQLDITENYSRTILGRAKKTLALYLSKDIANETA